LGEKNVLRFTLERTENSARERPYQRKRIDKIFFSRGKGKRGNPGGVRTGSWGDFNIEK